MSDAIDPPLAWPARGAARVARKTPLVPGGARVGTAPRAIRRLRSA